MATASPALAVVFFLSELQNSALGQGTLMGLGMITAHLMTPRTSHVPTEHSQQKAKRRDGAMPVTSQQSHSYNQAGTLFYLNCFSLGKRQLVETSTLRRTIET